MAMIRNKEIAAAWDRFSRELHNTAHSRDDYKDACEEIITDLEGGLEAMRDENRDEG